MAKKRGLGRGLDALLMSKPEDIEPLQVPLESASPEGYKQLALDTIQPGEYQPRRDLEPQALEDLAASIKAQGVMQPIVVRPVDDARFEIIAGERRWRAAKLAELAEIPAIVRDVPNEAAIAMALIENIQREDLNAMEEAIALQRLQDEFELTQQQVADAVGKSRSAVSNLLRLMKLQADVRIMLEHGDLDMGHARALLALEDQQQLEVAEEVVGKGLSVRQTEELVRKWQSGELPREVAAKPAADPALSEFASRLTERLDTKVAIRQNAKGKGKITINFDSPERLEQLLAQLSGEVS